MQYLRVLLQMLKHIVIIVYITVITTWFTAITTCKIKKALNEHEWSEEYFFRLFYLRGFLFSFNYLIINYLFVFLNDFKYIKCCKSIRYGHF